MNSIWERCGNGFLQAELVLLGSFLSVTDEKFKEQFHQDLTVIISEIACPGSIGSWSVGFSGLVSGLQRGTSRSSTFLAFTLCASLYLGFFSLDVSVFPSISLDSHFLSFLRMKELSKGQRD